MKTHQPSSAWLTAGALAVVQALVFTPGLSYAGFAPGALSGSSTNVKSSITASPAVAWTGSLPDQSGMGAAYTATQPTEAAPTVAQPGKPVEQPGAVTPPKGKGKKGGAAVAAAPGVAPSGKDVGKGVVPLAPATPGPEWAVSAGGNSRYMFKGRDNVDWSTNEPADSSVWYAKVAMAWQGLGVSVGYLQAVDETVPRMSDDRNGEYYSEVLAGINYTSSIIGGILDATVGYNAYFFPEDSFWGGDYQGEAFAQLAYVQIPHLRPSITYSYFHADTYVDLEGYFLEARIDGDFKVFDNGTVSVGINPYVSVGYDGIEYTGEGADWSAVEIGLRVPITINDNLIIALNGSYGWDLGNDQSSYSTTGPWNDEVGFVGGASVTYRF